ncbi:hypothetical protein C440_14684 [Haloferax mucosum ATCC BAA-1512]|uniref:Uncharacterized protein n=1 Tax=Haloferax mucosum ATCC BAA-1512 TaxID=662479 RepID=M0I804_9EURY|nr:hypothetical protein [Haloferax mucosum]ELZ91569.1 hypothetical protein C440_14684 [Haloferax mucosum ATCC BAA-1512]
MVETETYTIEGPNGDTEDVELPAGLVDIFSEQGEEPTDVVADVVVQAFAQQAHVVAHHNEGGAPADIAEINEKMEELFEERFGVALADALGHSH